MKDILDKITSYNLFNYLVPGILFAVILERFTAYSLLQENMVVGAFLYYFVGLVVSRFGSLVIEPLLKAIGFVQFAPYADFVSASKLDDKIEAFSEVNNMYRTLIAMLILLLGLKIYEGVATRLLFLNGYGLQILLVLLLIMFLFSYRKQTAYISKRIKVSKGGVTNHSEINT